MIKDLLIVIDNGPQAEPFLKTAIRIAEGSRAYCEVAMLSPGPLVAAEFAPLGALYVPDEQLRLEEQARLVEVRALVDDATTPVEVYGVRDDVAWIAHDLKRSHPLADLIVTGPEEAWEVPWLRRRVIETLLLTTGTPLLLLPSNHAFGPIHHAVLGWKPSREASRAVHDLAALAEPGATIDVAMIDAVTNGAGQNRQAVEVERHLVRRGFKVALHTRNTEEWSTVADMLQHFAVEQGADILAVGGYAHSRMREAVLGGVTSQLVAASRLPVLLSH